MLLTGAAAARDPGQPGHQSPGIQSITPPGSALDLADAIASDQEVLTDAAFQTTTDGTPTGVADNGSALAGFPTDGGTYAILTSGDATDAQNDQSFFASTNNGGGAVRGGGEQDVTVLGIGLDVPAAANCLTIDFRFLSEEFPDFVGGSVNDAFVAELDETTWTASGSGVDAPDNFAFDAAGNVISINTAGMTAEAAVGTAYGGATPMLSASTPVTPGTHTLYLSIFDQGDQIYHSAVFLDALVLGTTGPGGCQPGATAVSMDKVVDDSTVGPGDQVTYTITITNDSAAAVGLDSISDTLPDGFAYVPGSTTGATTANPGSAGQTLTWDEEAAYTVPGQGSITLSFSATATSTPGTYLNNASADAETPGVSVTPTGPDAPVTVEEGAATGNIIIQKATNPECASTVFDFTASYDADGPSSPAVSRTTRARWRRERTPSPSRRSRAEP